MAVNSASEVRECRVHQDRVVWTCAHAARREELTCAQVFFLDWEFSGAIRTYAPATSDVNLAGAGILTQTIFTAVRAACRRLVALCMCCLFSP